MFSLNQHGDLLSPHHVVWLTKLEKDITWSVKAARTARAKWSCFGLTGSYYWRRYYQVTLMKANNQQFSVGMDDMLETDKTFQYYWATFHNSVFVIACKLQLRDHTYYTMIHFSQNYPQRHLQISKGTPVFDRSVWNGCLDSMIIKNWVKLQPTPSADRRDGRALPLKIQNLLAS